MLLCERNPGCGALHKLACLLDLEAQPVALQSLWRYHLLVTYCDSQLTDSIQEKEVSYGYQRIAAEISGGESRLPS